MSGPGKGTFKRVGFQSSSKSQDVPQPYKSSSRHGISTPSRLSKSQNVSRPHKSVRENNIQESQPKVPRKKQAYMQLEDEEIQEEEVTGDIPQSYKSSSNRHEISKPSKLSKRQHVSHPHKSVGENDIQESQPKVPQKRQAYTQLEDEEIQEGVQTESGDHEDNSEDDHEVNSPQLETEIGSTSHGTSITRKETRALNEAKKRRLDKGKLVFEIDECAGRIIGDDSQRFITKGGCLVREYGMFDGTTWKNHPDFLKTDIISKCVENSTFNRKCKRSVDAIDSQLGNQHKNRQYRFHVIYQNFPTHEEALVDPPSGIELSDWVKLCDKFASEKFQKRREGKNVNAIDNYEIAHYCEKKKEMVSKEAADVLNKLRNEEAAGAGTPAEICFKVLKRVPGHLRGRSAPKKEILAVENLRTIVELERKKSAALEEKLKEVTVEQDDMKKCMGLMMKEIQRLSKLVPDISVS